MFSSKYHARVQIVLYHLVAMATLLSLDPDICVTIILCIRGRMDISINIP